MRKALVFLLLGLFSLGALVPGNNTSELAKVPNLIRHFFEHQQEASGALDFVAFMHLHYGFCSEAANHRNSSHKKESLPLINAQFHVQYFITQSVNIDPFITLYSHKNEWNLFYFHFYKYQFNPSFFTPPKA